MEPRQSVRYLVPGRLGARENMIVGALTGIVVQAAQGDGDLAGIRPWPRHAGAADTAK